MTSYVKDNIVMLRKLGDNFGVYEGAETLLLSPKFPKINIGDIIVFDNNDSSMVSVEFEDTGLVVPTTFYFVLIKHIIAVMYSGDTR